MLSEILKSLVIKTEMLMLGLMMTYSGEEPRALIPIVVNGRIQNETKQHYSVRSIKIDKHRPDEQNE